jgi:DNA-binding Xre family transcriptional regulator
MQGRVVCRLKELVARREVETGKRLSYDKLADDIGVGERTLRRWANNQMDHKVIAAICEYFDVQPGDWLDYVPNSGGAE